MGPQPYRSGGSSKLGHICHLLFQSQCGFCSISLLRGHSVVKYGHRTLIPMWALESARSAGCTSYLEVRWYRGGPSTQYLRTLVPKMIPLSVCWDQKPEILSTWTLWGSYMWIHKQDHDGLITFSVLMSRLITSPGPSSRASL